MNEILCNGYLLAGGASSRFGSDKALAVIDGSTMLERMCSLIRAVAGKAQIVASAGRYANAPAEIVEDRWPGEGPLGGIVTALEASRNSGSKSEWNLIVSCDMPFLTAEWLQFLVERAAISESQAVVPRSGHGLEPLCACWRTNSYTVLKDAFLQGTRKVTEGLKLLRTEVLDEDAWKRFDSAGRLFWNMNTPEDYREAKRMLSSKGDCGSTELANS